MNSNVSVIIPTKNRGALLMAAVKSAVESEAAPFEIIVVDAGSTDGSISALKETFGNRIRLVELAATNPAAARNAGAAAASGDYLGFLDSDDLMLAAKITCLGDALSRDPALGLVHGRMLVIDLNGVPNVAATTSQEAAFSLGERIGTTYEALASHCAMFTSASLVRRRAFELIGGYDESLDVYEDWDLYLRLSLHWRLAYLPCCCAHYRVWPGNVSWARTAEGVVLVSEKHLAAPPDLTPYAARLARYGFYSRLTEANHILVRGGQTRRAALQAVRQRPLTALRDNRIRRAFLRSLIPSRVLRRRRPPLPARTEPSIHSSEQQR